MRRHSLFTTFFAAALSILLIIWVMVAAGCAKEKVADAPTDAVRPNYGRPLPPGQSALRKITDPARMPNLTTAYSKRDPLLSRSMDESLRWFAAPSSRQHFPFEGITHEQARTSVKAMKDLVEHSPSDYVFVSDVERLFDVYESIGCDDAGTVLFTGYYSPIFKASRTSSAQYGYPLYKRPADLATDPKTGEPQGRKRPDGSVEPYPTRREIEESKMLAGTELVWLEDAFSAYIIHVNGSAKLMMDDGSVLYIGYAGKTDRPYASLGQALVKANLLSNDDLSLSGIRRAHKENPAEVQQLMLANESYVFFTEYPGDKWPSGSLGVRVTGEASLATDKKIFPRGGVVLVDTHTVTFSKGPKEFLRFMLDQDTGGAIKAPGRADLFMGVGSSAEILAGGQYAEGRLYYFFLKPEYVEQFK